MEIWILDILKKAGFDALFVGALASGLSAAAVTVANLSLSASVVIFAVLLLRLLLRKAPKKWSYLLWTVVGFRLCCPVSLNAAFSIFRLYPVYPMSTVEVTKASSEIAYIPQDIGRMSIQDLVELPDTTIETVAYSGEPLLPRMFIGTVFWSAGLAAMLIYGVAGYLKMRRRLTGSVLLWENVYETDSIRCPFILGLLRPKIYLPIGLEGDTLRYVLAHERYHIKRRDYLIKVFAFLLLAVHWFDPLVWLAFYLMCRDMEMSCDEKVLAEENGIAAEYSMSLLSFATARRFPSPGPLAFGETGVKSRIKNVLHWKRPRTWVTLAAVAVCVVAVAACGTNPKTEDGKATGNVVMNTYSGTLADIYEENGDTFIKVDTETGGDITFMLTTSTEINPVQNLIPGQQLRVRCEEYDPDTGYRPAFSIEMLPSATETPADNDFPTLTLDDNEPYAAQIAVIAANRNVWRVYEEFDAWGYAVTDLDQNGRLELIAAECHGTGHFSTDRIWEVSADGTSLAPVEGMPNEYGSGPWMLDESVPVFYDGARDLYHYRFTGETKYGASRYSETQTGLTLSGGTVTTAELAHKFTFYAETTEITCFLPDGTVISAEDYGLAADREYQGCQKLYAALPWIRELRMDEVNAEELEELLMESWRGFGSSEIPIQLVEG